MTMGLMMLVVLLANTTTGNLNILISFMMIRERSHEIKDKEATGYTTASM